MGQWKQCLEHHAGHSELSGIAIFPHTTVKWWETASKVVPKGLLASGWVVIHQTGSAQMSDQNNGWI